MNIRRFPMPVSHARAPVRCPLGTALLALAAAFAAGACFTTWFIALVIQGAV